MRRHKTLHCRALGPCRGHECPRGRHRGGGAGGGRSHADDAIDASVGLSDVIDVGAQVRTGSPLCIVHAASDADADSAIDMVRRAIRIGDAAPGDRPVVMERIVQ